MPPLRSRTVTHGRNMAGARALLRATGVANEDFGKPIIAVANRKNMKTNNKKNQKKEKNK